MTLNLTPYTFTLQTPTQECRDWLDANWDMDQFLKYLVVYNFGGAWDNNFHNFYPYQRATDGRWTLLPWDADRLFGEFWSWSSSRSLYIGEESDSDTRSKPNNNYIVRVALNCHKARFQEVS